MGSLGGSFRAICPRLGDEVNAFYLITFLLLGENLFFCLLLFFIIYIFICWFIHLFIYFDVIVLNYADKKYGRVFGQDATHHGRWIIFVLSNLKLQQNLKQNRSSWRLIFTFARQTIFLNKIQAQSLVSFLVTKRTY